MAALDALMECLIRTAGLPAKVSILQWATSLRYQVLTQVSLRTGMVALRQHAWLNTNRLPSSATVLCRMHGP